MALQGNCVHTTAAAATCGSHVAVIILPVIVVITKAANALTPRSNPGKRLTSTQCHVEQEINGDSQHCSACSALLSDYFCGICKLFTSGDKSPFHCHKCGICRINKNSSFHCDVCNVCLDKKLEGKHKCRPGSGHDECCVCLEDAFSGCQVLPCSHKVHKQCGIDMVQNGVRTCPICRDPLFPADDDQ